MSMSQEPVIEVDSEGLEEKQAQAALASHNSLMWQESHNAEIRRLSEQLAARCYNTWGRKQREYDQLRHAHGAALARLEQLEEQAASSHEEAKELDQLLTQERAERERDNKISAEALAAVRAETEQMRERVAQLEGVVFDEAERTSWQDTCCKLRAQLDEANSELDNRAVNGPLPSFDEARTIVGTFRAHGLISDRDLGRALRRFVAEDYMLVAVEEYNTFTTAKKRLAALDAWIETFRG